VLYAISGGDRRRQREVDAARHVLECELVCQAQ
jgi:serine/threonine-protein kinase RsbT